MTKLGNRFVAVRPPRRIFENWGKGGINGEIQTALCHCLEWQNLLVFAEKNYRKNSRSSDIALNAIDWARGAVGFVENRAVELYSVGFRVTYASDRLKKRIALTQDAHYTWHVRDTVPV